MDDGEQRAEEMGGSICPGCGEEIDEATCYCGEEIDGSAHDEHYPVPMGCLCHERLWGAHRNEAVEIVCEDQGEVEVYDVFMETDL